MDAWYVRDMQKMFAAELMGDLQAFAGPMDAHVKEQELLCARLMTALQPVFARAEIDVPHPTRAKSLNAFPLEMSRPSILDADLESAKEVLDKVRQ